MATEWHCFHCKESVEKVRAQVEYLEVVRPVEAMRCPSIYGGCLLCLPGGSGNCQHRDYSSCG